MNISQLIGGTVDKYQEDNQDPPRDYLGISKIGCAMKCEREAWFRAHGKISEPLKAQTLRILRLGNMLEETIIKDLKDAGFNVHSEQKEVIATQGDKKLVGHIDGIIHLTDLEFGFDDEPCLLEIKTANQSRYNRKLKVGYNDWDIDYKSQIHAYAMLLGLKWIVTVAENKNNCKRDFELIKADYKFATEALQLPFKIWNGRKPLGICSSKKQFSYLWCDFNNECL